MLKHSAYSLILDKLTSVGGGAALLYLLTKLTVVIFGTAHGIGEQIAGLLFGTVSVLGGPSCDDSWLFR